MPTNSYITIMGAQPLTRKILAAWLFRSGASQGWKLTIFDCNGQQHTGFLEFVEREDGSGNNYNLRLSGKSIFVKVKE